MKILINTNYRDSYFLLKMVFVYDFLTYFYYIIINIKNSYLKANVSTKFMYSSGLGIYQENIIIWEVWIYSDYIIY